MAWCLAGLTVLALWPSLRLPWMLVDDAESLRRGMDALGRLAAVDLSGLVRTILEPESGRARPVYWLYQTAAYVAGGLSAPAHHGLRVGLAAATVVFAARAARAAGGRLAGWMTGLLLVGSPAYENWYRLGPVEPLLAGLLALILWNEWAREGRPGQSAIRTLGLAALMGTKETAVAVVVPAAAAGLVRSGSGRWRMLRSAGGWALVMMGLLAWVRLAGGGATYGGRAALGSEFWPRLRGYAMACDWFYGGLPLLLLCTGVAGLAAARRGGWDARRRAQATALAGTAAFLLPLGLWPDWLDRYLLPVLVWLTLYLGLEMAALADLARRRRWIRAAGLAGLGLAGVLAVGWVRHSAWCIVDAARYYQTGVPDHNGVAWLARELPHGARVFVNHGDREEITQEIRMHLALTRGRPDLTVSTYDFSGVAYRPGDAVILHASGDPSRLLERFENYRGAVSAIHTRFSRFHLEPAGQWSLTYVPSAPAMWGSAHGARRDNRWLAWRVAAGRAAASLSGLELPGARAVGFNGVVASSVAWVWQDQVVPAIPGRVYHLSAWQQVVGGGPRVEGGAFLCLEALDAHGRVRRREWGIVSPMAVRTRAESVLDAPRGTRALRVRLAKRLGAGTVRFDHVTLADLEAPRFPWGGWAAR